MSEATTTTTINDSDDYGNDAEDISDEVHELGELEVQSEPQILMTTVDGRAHVAVASAQTSDLDVPRLAPDIEAGKGKDKAVTIRRMRALEVMLAYPEETLTEQARIAGLSRWTMRRYLADKTFRAELQERISHEITRSKAGVLRAVVDSAMMPGANQPAMAKLFFLLAGDLKNQIELSGKDGGPVEMASVALDALSPDTKRTIIAALERDKALKSQGLITAGDVGVVNKNNAVMIDESEFERQVMNFQEPDTSGKSNNGSGNGIASNGNADSNNHETDNGLEPNNDSEPEVLVL